MARVYEIVCNGDANDVANMLEDISKKIRHGAIHSNNEFYHFDSHGYVKEENKPENR